MVIKCYLISIVREYKVEGAMLVRAKINSSDTISCDETSQDDETYGYEDDLTAQPATSTSIIIIIIMEKTEAGLKGLCIREIKTI